MAEREDISLPIFNGGDWNKWKFRLRLVLEAKTLLEVIDNTCPEDIAEALIWKRNDVKARSIIVQALSNSQLEHVLNEKTATDMIKKLDSLYSPTSTSLKLISKRKLLDLKMQDSDDPEKFITTFEKLINEVKSTGETLSNDDHLNYLLLTLPKTFSHIIDIVDALPNESKTVEYVKSKLLIEFKKNRPNTSSENEGSAFNSERSGYSRKCFKCGRDGHIQKFCNYNSNVNGNSNGPRGNQRYNYSRRGSFNGRGRRLGRGRYFRNGYGNSAQAEASVQAQINGGEESNSSSFGIEVMISQSQMNEEVVNGKIIWLLDSGCSDHIVNDAKYFTDMKKLEKPVNIKVGDGYLIKALGIGKIVVKFVVGNVENVVDINDCYYAPEMEKNLLSFSKMTDRGNKLLAQNDIVKIFNEKENLIAIGVKKENLYYLTGNIVQNVTSNMSVNEKMSDKEKFHRLLGHVNFNYLTTLCKRKLVDGLPENLESEYLKCATCIESKMHNLPFENNRYRAKKILEIVHTDLNGPHKTTGYNGEKYFLTFVDDYSKAGMVYTIKTKDEVYTCFRDYINKVENLTGEKIKRLRCDNGTEYINKQIFEFAREKGIFIEPCPPYVHELNGTAERYNRSIMETARCLLKESDVSLSYWPEIIKTASYLKNRTLANTIIKKTPYELFIGRKPNIKNLKLYGSKVFARIPEQKRSSKWDNKAELGILVGYEKVGYRVLINNKVVIARHVDIVEEDVKLIGCGNGENRVKISGGFEDNADNLEARDEIQEVENVRQKRQTNRPNWHNDYVININFSKVVPNSYREAVESNEKVEWLKAMQNEYDCLMKNDTWNLIDIKNVPSDEKIIQVKWVFKIKSDNSFKARLVVLGYQQPPTLEEEVYSPVAKMSTLKILLSVSCSRGYYIEQMDVQTAFLNGKVNTNIYIYQPEGFIMGKNKVCKLNRALYGLRESPRTWYNCFHEHMLSLEFAVSKIDSCLYFKQKEDWTIYLILYVDDLLICCSDVEKLNEIKKLLKNRFEMKDLGKVQNYLGIDIEYDQTNKCMSLSQSKYIESLAEKYDLIESKSYQTPIEINLKLEPSEVCDVNIQYRNLIGALLYISQGTRIDTSYATNYLSVFQNCYSDVHYKYAKRVLKYLYGTKELKLKFMSNHESETMDCFVDADWAGDVIDRKSRSGIIIRVFGNPVLWISRKQKIVTRSTCHSEYVALADAVTEVLSIKEILKDLNVAINFPVQIFEDNSSARFLAVNGNFSKNSKHIDVSLYFVHDYVTKNVIDVKKISSEDQLADILTKALSSARFIKLRNMLNIIF